MVKVFIISPVSTHYVKVHEEGSEVNIVVSTLETSGTLSDHKKVPSKDSALDGWIPFSLTVLSIMWTQLSAGTLPKSLPLASSPHKEFGKAGNSWNVAGPELPCKHTCMLLIPALQ